VIRVDSITIKEFRGIRDLSLDFNGKNFAVCGPNGTGKSGVVDALEFALTGNVSRLSGEGRGEISLKQHGPHVDSRDDPDKARVVVKVTIPKLKKTVTIERSLKIPATSKVTPSDSAILEVLRQVEDHPEFVLSRRELIRYVLATPGKRDEEVQALLHLDQVGQVRSGLQKIANSCEKQLPSLKIAAIQAQENLLRAIGISELSKEKVLVAVNSQRMILGLPVFADLSESTSFKDGMATPERATPQRIPKTQALADIRAAREALVEISNVSTIKLVKDVLTDLNVLASDPVVSASIQRESFYTTGMGLIDGSTCPFCDTSWNPEELKRNVQAKINHLNEISRKRTAIETKIAPLTVTLQKLQTTINTLVGYAATATPPVAFSAGRDYVNESTIAIKKLNAFLPITETISVLTNLPSIPEGVLNAIDELQKVVDALPEPTKHDSAREWLTVAQERLEVWRGGMRKHKTATEQAQMARKIYDIYTNTSDTVLGGIYAAVQEDFATLYSFINRDDEDRFKAKLVPSMGKLGFDVNFYNRGFFPPGAYHSEGHQDGMGLCLYLALMRYLQGEWFTFAVLDDVLMSVDTGHRREVCTLLKKEFPNTQFIMTTHDPIWLQHMRTEGLTGSRSFVHFKNWTVDHGPTRWDDRDVWTEIDDHLKENDVRAAAGLLRHYLEFISAELCHRLRAQVEFRGDARYQLGELFPPAISQMRKLFSRAKEAANSWNQKEVIQQLTAREKKFAILAEASKAEQWQVNTAIHYNSWDNLSKEDFNPVVEAFRELLSEFACSEPECREYLRVLPDREIPESIRCGCGKININLLKKESV